MPDRGFSEKHGLALFCAFIAGWTLIRIASRRPAAESDEPIPFATRSARRYAPAAAVAPPADGAPAMTPPEPAFKQDAVSLLSHANEGASGGPPALADEAAAGSAAQAASASGYSPPPGLSGGPNWQMPPPSGGSGASASVLPPSFGRAPAAGAAAPRGGFGAPSRGKTVASGGASFPGAAQFGGRVRAKAPAGPSPAGFSSAAAGAEAAAGGSGGLGGGDAGGGGGGGGDGGLSGGPKAEKPKGSAGPPTDGGGGQGGPAGAAGPNGRSASASAPAAAADPDTSPDVADVQPVLGTPRPADPVPSGDEFALDPNQPATVPTYVAKTKTGTAVTFTAKMAIDADGAGGWWLKDKTDQEHGNDGSKTSARYANGDSLNPGQIPFIVVPTDFGRAHPGVQLGDYAAVTYGGRTVYAIVGDKGPKGVVGEGSISLARSLRIPADPNNGGVRAGVTYVILPGTKDSALPRTAAAVQTRGRTLFQKAGIPPV
jgi:hypothetical protein